MLLSARMLNGVVDANHFDVVTTLEATQGDTSDIFFQLVDASVEKTRDPHGRRYVPALGATVEVTVTDIASGVTIDANASQPFSADDRSIWKIAHSPLNGVDLSLLRGTYSLKLKLTEGSKVKYGFASQALSYARNVPEF